MKLGCVILQIVPILYGNVDDRKVHQISLDEAEGLRQSCK